MRIEADAPAQGQDRLLAVGDAIPATTPPARAYQALTVAELARLNHRGEVDAWQAAVAATRAADEAFLLCYSLFRLAEAQVPDATRATGTARECLALADELAADLAQDVRALARRARLRIEPATPADAPPAESTLRFRLTHREHEVLALVAEGHSNGQIAAALYISPKTASVHVSNILAKLNVSTRTEAAAHAYRLGITQ
jgi:DNA-binding CsgD family transcriptional regulator